MDKINEMLTWLMLVVFGYWFTTNKTVPAGDQRAPEAAPARGPAIPEASDTLSERIENPRNTAFCEGSILAAGLSEMMGRRKMRRNLMRRKDDQAS